jgi:retron-type reverse transcriptase
MEPIFEREFLGSSHGFRPKRSAKDALRMVDRGLKAGKGYVVDADIKRYFDTIPHEPLLARVAEKIADGRVMGVLKQMLQRGVLENREWVESEAGTPQGGVISPLLANVYLNPLDHMMQKSGYTFAEIDGWIRGRLRSILRKRAHLKGRGRGRDHQRWTNDFFKKHGYFSLYDTCVEMRQSAMR